MSLTLEEYRALPDVDRIQYRDDLGVESYTLLLEQFKESENILGIMNIVSYMKQQLDDAIITVAKNRRIDTAVGLNLDLIGEELGVPRNNASDDEYRILLKIRAFRTTTSGTRPEIIDILSRSIGVDKSKIKSYVGLNKSFDLAFPLRCTTKDTLREEMRKMFPLVSNFRLVHKADEQPVFGFTSLASPQQDEQIKGFGSVYDKGDINNSQGLGEGFLGGRLATLIGSSSLVAD